MKFAALFPRLNRPSKKPGVPVLERGATIPKIIHQIYFSDKDMPAALADNLEHLKALNPGWEHRLYDEQAMHDFVARHYDADVLRQYQRLNPFYGAAKADFFRYLLLYKTGGIYLDIKSSAHAPFEQVLREDDTFLLSQWRNRDDGRFRGWGVHDEIAGIAGGEYQQWNIIATPGHPFLKSVIDNVMRNIDVYNPGLHGTGQLGVLRVTGPIAYTLAIAPLLKTCPHRFVDSAEDLQLSYSIFEGERHATLFKDHYSVLRDPVVLISPLKRVIAAAFNLLRALLHKARAVKAAAGRN